MKRFSDFSEEEKPIEGTKLKLDEILNKELLIVGCRFNRSRYGRNQSGDVLTLQFELDGTRHIVFTGSDVLNKQMRKYEKELPFTATIVKVDKYYTLK